MNTHLTARLRGLLSFIIVAQIVSWAAAAETERGFVDRVYRDTTGEHKYVVFVPHSYTSDRQWPVILFLHSAAERGTDGKRQVEEGLGRAIRAHEQTFPFIAVFPQCEDRTGSARGGWLPQTSDGARALAILVEVEKTYRTDKDRVYLTGISMGGFGTWAHAAADARRWAAIVPIAGGGDPAWASKIGRMPVWAFHGGEDRAVPVNEERQMIAALRGAGASPKYTEYPRVGHHSWDAAYSTDELYTWLLQQRRSVGNSWSETAVATTRSASENPKVVGNGLHAVPIRATPIARNPTEGVSHRAAERPVSYASYEGSKPAMATATESSLDRAAQEPDAPFVPALEIPRAGFVRLGTEILDAISDSVPQLAPPDALSGTLPDVQSTTSAEGLTFSVQLADISYSGRLSRAIVEPMANNRLAVTIAARDVDLVINRTYVSGSGRSAVAGPLHIVLGHRTDLPLRIVVQPIVEQRRLRFKLLDTSFRLPRDNWYVGRPEWVKAHGLGMTPGRVASGLQSGLYRDPGRIEREVIALVPRMLQQLEDRVQLDQIDRLMAAMWPLPVYQPQIKTWPSAIRTDADGVTLVLGISAASPDGSIPASGPKVVDLRGSDGALAVGGKQFRVGLAPGLLEPLSEQMVAADLARVLIEDMPMKKLAPLADAKALAGFVPDLKERGEREVRTELVLVGPLLMSRVETESGDRLLFDVPKAIFAVTVRPAPDSKTWVPYLDIPFRLRQVVKAEVKPMTPSTRTLALSWTGEATSDMLARFAPGYMPTDSRIDTEGLRDILTAGWKEWTETGPLATVPIDDIDLGFDKLRADRVDWESAFLTATFAPAGIAIKNLTGQPVTYEVKGPYSDWGGPNTLEPEKDHRYPISYPVTCRFRVNGKENVYTLSAGARFEFQASEDGEVDLYVSGEDRSN
ncbi:MAG: dienelactone hydrolase family protein [Planctomycetes bacterium]|nr:dienelactone hydrolase family protein [Planctomycetota bacterium]